MKPCIEPTKKHQIAFCMNQPPRLASTLYGFYEFYVLLFSITDSYRFSIAICIQMICSQGHRGPIFSRDYGENYSLPETDTIWSKVASSGSKPHQRSELYIHQPDFLSLSPRCEQTENISLAPPHQVSWPTRHQLSIQNRKAVS
jgi:hypothetical protein